MNPPAEHCQLTDCVPAQLYRVRDRDHAVAIFATHHSMYRYVTVNGRELTAPLEDTRLFGDIIPTPRVPADAIMQLNPIMVANAWFLPTPAGLRPARGVFIHIDIVDTLHRGAFADVVEGPILVLVPRADVPIVI